MAGLPLPPSIRHWLQPLAIADESFYAHRMYYRSVNYSGKALKKKDNDIRDTKTCQMRPEVAAAAQNGFALWRQEMQQKSRY